MIFGTDAVSTPDAVSLPTVTDAWFTQGNGTSVEGTQAPAYWFNKVGGELDALIEGLGGTLSMTTRNQILSLLKGQSTIGSGITYEVLPSGKVFYRGPVTLASGVSQVTVVLPKPPGFANSFPTAFRGGLCVDGASATSGSNCFQYAVGAGPEIAGSDPYGLNSITVCCSPYVISFSGTIQGRTAATGWFEAWGD
jgi:hypothetical protein